MENKKLTAKDLHEQVMDNFKKIEKCIMTSGIYESVEHFFADLHLIGDNITRFIQLYFQNKSTVDIFQNMKLLDDMNRLTLLIKIK